MTSLETEKIFQDLVGGPSGYERLVDERTPLKMSMKKSLKHSNAKPKPPEQDQTEEQLDQLERAMRDSVDEANAVGKVFDRHREKIKSAEDEAQRLKVEIEFSQYDEQLGSKDQFYNYFRAFKEIGRIVENLKGNILLDLETGGELNETLTANFRSQAAAMADIRTQAEDLRKQMLAGVGDGQMPLVKRLQNNFTKFLEVVCNAEGLRQTLEDEVERCDSLRKLIGDHFTGYRGIITGKTASDSRIKSLQNLEHKMTDLGRRSFTARKRYMRILTIWQSISRIITLGCVVMSALIGNGSLEAKTVTLLGLILAISNCVNGTVGEILAKVNEKLAEINDAITVITLAKIKLMKGFDSALNDGTMDMNEYQGILDTLTGAMKKLGQQGLDNS